MSDLKQCDGCRNWRFDVSAYWPDDTACVWCLCKPCHERADVFCRENRISSSMADHRTVLNRLGRPTASQAAHICPTCGGTGRV